MLVGPYEFEILMIYAGVRSFAIHTSAESKIVYESKYGQEAFEKHIFGVTGLCQKGLLGLDTASELNAEGTGVSVRFSYHWTSLGNSVLNLMELINNETCKLRNESLPEYFE